MQITLQGSQCKSALRLLPWLELFLCVVAYIHKEYESGESTFTQTYAHYNAVLRGDHECHLMQIQGFQTQGQSDIRCP